MKLTAKIHVADKLRTVKTTDKITVNAYSKKMFINHRSLELLFECVQCGRLLIMIK